MLKNTEVGDLSWRARNVKVCLSPQEPSAPTPSKPVLQYERSMLGATKLSGKRPMSPPCDSTGVGATRLMGIHAAGHRLSTLAATKASVAAFRPGEQWPRAGVSLWPGRTVRRRSRQQSSDQADAERPVFDAASSPSRPKAADAASEKPTSATHGGLRERLRSYISPRVNVAGSGNLKVPVATCAV